MVRNTITGSGEGITLTRSSINNMIANNAVTGNDVVIVTDPASQANILRARLNATQPD